MISIPRYPNCLAVGILEGKGIANGTGFKCINEDLVQLILYPDSKLNKLKVDKRCGREDTASLTYSKTSSAYNDIRCSVIQKEIGSTEGCCQIFSPLLHG